MLYDICVKVIYIIASFFQKPTARVTISLASSSFV